MANLEKKIPEKKATIQLNLTKKEMIAMYEQAGKGESPELKGLKTEELAKLYREYVVNGRAII